MGVFHSEADLSALRPIGEQVARALDQTGARFERGEWWFHCVAHDERTPSAAYHPEKMTWYCQGCQTHGGVLDLARRLGIDTGSTDIDPAELARLRADRERLAVEIAESRRRQGLAMAAWWREARLQDQLRAHDDVLAMLEREGVRRNAAAAFGLGWTTYGVGGRGYPALAIPWTVRGETRAVQYRLLAPDVPGGRYRWHDGSRPTVYNADAVLVPDDDTIVVVEGAKKCAALWGHGLTSVCAIANKGGWRPEYAPPFGRFGRVVFALDPDARSEAEAAARTVRGARVARLPCKPDDFLVATGGDVDALWRILSHARKVD